MYPAVSLQALFNLVRKHHDTGKLIELPRRARPRKLSQEMVTVLEEAWCDKLIMMNWQLDKLDLY